MPFDRVVGFDQLADGGEKFPEEVRDELIAYLEAANEAARVALSAVGKADLPLNVLDFGADPTGNDECTAAFVAAFDEGINTGRAVYTPAGEFRFDAKISTPGGLTWVWDPNTVLIKNFAGTVGDRVNNCLIVNESAPVGADIVNGNGWEPDEYDEDITIQCNGGRVRHASGAMIGGGFYMVGVRRLRMSDAVVEHSRQDWAYTFAGEDIVCDNLATEVPEDTAAVLEDGIHILQGRRMTFNNPNIVAGDDAFAFGANYNTAISDIKVNGGRLKSWKAHSISFYQYRAGITSAFAPPTTKIKNIYINGVNAESGILRNGLIFGTLDYILGTAQAGAASTITLAATASAEDDFYTGCRITTTGGTGSGQVGTITDYVGSTKVATVSPDWGVTPDATTTYSIAGALLQNVHISIASFVGGDQDDHDGTLPNGIKLINAKDVYVSDIEVRNSIRDSFYFEDIVGKLVLNDISNTDPQSVNTTFYALRVLRCPDVVTHGGSLTRSVTQVVRVEDSNLTVNGTELSGMGNATAAFRLLNTSGKTTQLTANGAKFVRALGATTSRAVQNEGTGCSYVLNNCDFTQCDVMVVDSAAPAYGVIRGAIPSSLQTITATASDATPSVRGANVLVTANAVATTITDLDDGYEGQVVTVQIADANTTVDFTGTNLKGNAGHDWSPASGDAMVCTRRGSSWYCGVQNLAAANDLWARDITIGDQAILPQSATLESYNTTDLTDYERVRAFWSSNIFTIASEQGGAGSQRSIQIGASPTTLTVGAGAGVTVRRNNTSVTPLFNVTSTGLLASSGTQVASQIDPTINQSGTAGYTALLVNPTESATGSGSKLLADFQVGGVSKASIDHAGAVAAGSVSTADLAVSGAVVAGSLSLTTDLAVTDGGTGRATGATAYGLIAAGTTATNPQQTVATGAAGDVLVSGGAGALPAFTTPTGTDAPVKATAPTLSAVTLGGANILPQNATLAYHNQSDQTTNYERGRLFWSSNIFTLAVENGGSGTLRTFQINVAPTTLTVGGSSVGATIARNSSAIPTLLRATSTGLTASSGTQTPVVIDPTINQSSTAGYSALYINPTESATGSGNKRLIDAAVAGTSKFTVDNAGTVTVSGTTATIRAGTATPEGAVTAAVGSMFLRTDGGAATTLYIKESGAGNTGWVAK